jgi:DNA-binding XRE family transcriptional regulator
MSEERRDISVEEEKILIGLPHGVVGRPDATGPGDSSTDDMIDSGEIDEPVPHGQFIGLTGLVHDLKERRTRLKLSLTDVADRSGLTRAAVSRLENGWNANPTLETLYRYALALNANIRLVAEDLVDEEELPGDDD